MSAKVRKPLPSPSEAPRRSRVLIVDDHVLLRRGMRVLIEHNSNFEVCGEASTAPEAMELAAKYQPDVAIVDISLKSTSGIDLTQALILQSPTLRILVVSMHDADVYAERALRAGASGYLMKSDVGENLIRAMDRIMTGQVYLSNRGKGKTTAPFARAQARQNRPNP